jgi:type IV secretory pathway TrbD component
MGGAPRSYAILNGTLAAVVAFAGALLPGDHPGHRGSPARRLLARRDPDAVEVMSRAMRIPNRLET